MPFTYDAFDIDLVMSDDDCTEQEAIAKLDRERTEREERISRADFDIDGLNDLGDLSYTLI